MSEELRVRVVALRAQGLTYERIGEETGVVPRTAWRWCNPERDRAVNRARNESKLAWAHEHDWLPCPDCGRPMGVGSPREGTERCRACRLELFAAVRERMVALRRDGLTNYEIADALGTTPHRVANALYRERKADPSIPRAPRRRKAVAR